MQGRYPEPKLAWNTLCTVRLQTHTSWCRMSVSSCQCPHGCVGALVEGERSLESRLISSGRSVPWEAQLFSLKMDRNKLLHCSLNFFWENDWILVCSVFRVLYLRGSSGKNWWLLFPWAQIRLLRKYSKPGLAPMSVGPPLGDYSCGLVNQWLTEQTELKHSRYKSHQALFKCALLISFGMWDLI